MKTISSCEIIVENSPIIASFLEKYRYFKIKLHLLISIFSSKCNQNRSNQIEFLTVITKKFANVNRVLSVMSCYNSNKERLYFICSLFDSPN